MFDAKPGPSSALADGATASSPAPVNAVFCAVSRFVVANGMQAAVADAFLLRPHQVDRADGFVSMQVLQGADDSREFWLMTEWRDEASFDRWHGSHAYRDAHKGIPRGLKLVKGAQVVRRMWRICQ